MLEFPKLLTDVVHYAEAILCCDDCFAGGEGVRVGEDLGDGGACYLD